MSDADLPSPGENLQATPPAQTAGRQKRLRLAGLLTLLLGLLLFAAYRQFAPGRQEKQLAGASLERLQTLSKQQPNDARVLYHLGRRQQAAGNTALALATFQRALPLAPEQADVWVAASEVTESEQGAQAALSLLEQYLRVHPKTASVHLAVARLARRQRLWERAYSEGREVTQLDAGNALGWQLYGQAAAMTERPQEAETALRKAFALEPHNWETQTSMGDLMVQNKRYSEAVPFFREANRLAPDKAVPYLSLGKTLLKVGAGPQDWQEAAAALERCKALRPDIPVVYLYLGQCLAKQGRGREALAALNEAKRRDPLNMDVYFELGKAYGQAGNAEAARKAFDRHKQLVLFNDQRRVLLARIERMEQTGKRDDADALRLDLARKLTANEMYDEAVGHYHQLLLHTPNRTDIQQELAHAQQASIRPDALLVQGENLLHRQRFADAAQAFEAALTRADSAQGWEGLGTAFASQGQIGKAIPVFLRALALDPKRPWAALAIGEAYAQIGLPDEAQKLLKTAAQNDATRDSARKVLQEMTGASAATPLARYSHLSLQVLRHPHDVGAHKELDTLAKQLRASGELPPPEMMQPLLQKAAAL